MAVATPASAPAQTQPVVVARRHSLPPKLNRSPLRHRHPLPSKRNQSPLRRRHPLPRQRNLPPSRRRRPERALGSTATGADCRRPANTCASRSRWPSRRRHAPCTGTRAAGSGCIGSECTHFSRARCRCNCDADPDPCPDDCGCARSASAAERRGLGHLPDQKGRHTLGAIARKWKPRRRHARADARRALSDESAQRFIRENINLIRAGRARCSFPAGRTCWQSARPTRRAR